MSLLITTEGVDSNRKTKLVNDLKKNNESNLTICSWRETKLGGKIKDLLNEFHWEKNRKHLFFSLVALEELTRKKIQPDLKNRVAIVDERINSALLYQDFAGREIELGETPEDTACREVFEEANLMIKELQKNDEEIVFFANLPPGNQHWVSRFFQSNKYLGKIKNKGEVVDIKFFNFPPKDEIAEERRSAYQFYLEKIKKLNYS